MNKYLRIIPIKDRRNALLMARWQIDDMKKRKRLDFFERLRQVKAKGEE